MFAGSRQGWICSLGCWPRVPNLHPAVFHVLYQRFPSQRQGGDLHPWALTQTESMCLESKRLCLTLEQLLSFKVCHAPADFPLNCLPNQE